MRDVDALVSFLRARLDEDERVALACQREVGTAKAGDLYDDGSLCEQDEYPSYPYGSRSAEMAFMARHDPARVLREVEAKQKIVNCHHGPHTCVKSFATAPIGDMPPGTFYNATFFYDETPCSTLLLLAAVFSDHPDFLEEWRLQ